ncbi:hypothetical protein ACIPC1_39465 [Streptomyces sp. NPDC087263]
MKILQRLDGVRGMRANGWQDDAVCITTILYDGLRYGAANHT